MNRPSHSLTAHFFVSVGRRYWEVLCRDPNICFELLIAELLMRPSPISNAGPILPGFQYLDEHDEKVHFLIVLCYIEKNLCLTYDRLRNCVRLRTWMF